MFAFANRNCRNKVAVRPTARRANPAQRSMDGPRPLVAGHGRPCVQWSGIGWACSGPSARMKVCWRESTDRIATSQSDSIAQRPGREALRRDEGYRSLKRAMDGPRPADLRLDASQNCRARTYSPHCGGAPHWRSRCRRFWIPAFAGMTSLTARRDDQRPAGPSPINRRDTRALDSSHPVTRVADGVVHAHAAARSRPGGRLDATS
jgi:hypothetical protein